MKKFLRRLTRVLIVSILLLAALYLARVPLLKGLGDFLITEDTTQSVDAAFILSGSVMERTREAMEVYKLDTDLLICTGETISADLEAFGEIRTDAELARDALLRMGADTSDIRVLKRGTSTYEESEEILGYSVTEDFRRIMIISSKFHTRRIQNVFRKKFREKGVEVIIRGADPIGYETDTWWLEESGMIFVTNEYLKLLYYAFKY
ncbi:MAG: YdcF family protein [Bacteroidota bacterium]